MRTMQSLFPRLKDTFVYEDTGEHRILMKTVCLLYNLRAHTVGINLINVHESFECQCQQQNEYDVKVIICVKYIFNLII
jgi:hypothetical protein